MHEAPDNHPAAGQPELAPTGSLGNGREVTRLRPLFLVLLEAAIFAIIAVLILALYRHEHKAVDQGVLRIRASVMAGILLIGFFFWQVGRVGRRIERDEQELEDIAPMTGLWAPGIAASSIRCWRAR